MHLKLAFTVLYTHRFACLKNSCSVQNLLYLITLIRSASKRTNINIIAAKVSRLVPP
jgi:hypothetical protein